MKEAMASGMSKSEAREMARRQFGAVEKTKEECRDMRRVNLIDEFYARLAICAANDSN